MPDYFTRVDATKFFDATTNESDIFPLPVVAAALGVGRNMMCKIPVQSILIKGRKYYRKGAILDWAETAPGMNLLLELRAKSTSIGRTEKNRSRAYQYHYTGDSGPDERRRKDLQIRRLAKELAELDRQLYFAPWPEGIKTAKQRKLAIETYIRLTQLKGRKPSRYGYSWWLITDNEARSKAHRKNFEAIPRWW